MTRAAEAGRPGFVVRGIARLFLGPEPKGPRPPSPLELAKSNLDEILANSHNDADLAMAIAAVGTSLIPHKGYVGQRFATTAGGAIQGAYAEWAYDKTGGDKSPVVYTPKLVLHATQRSPHSPSDEKPAFSASVTLNGYRGGNSKPKDLSVQRFDGQKVGNNQAFLLEQIGVIFRNVAAGGQLPAEQSASFLPGETALAIVEDELVDKLKRALQWTAPKDEVKKSHVQPALDFLTEVNEVGRRSTELGVLGGTVVTPKEGEEGIEVSDRLSFLPGSRDLVVVHIQTEEDSDGVAKPVFERKIMLHSLNGSGVDSGTVHYKGANKTDIPVVFVADGNPTPVIDSARQIRDTAEVMKILLEQRTQRAPEEIEAEEVTPLVLEVGESPKDNLTQIQDRLQAALAEWTVPEREIEVGDATGALKFMTDVNVAARQIARDRIKLGIVGTQREHDGLIVEHRVSVSTHGNLTILDHNQSAAGQETPVLSRRQIRLSVEEEPLPSVRSGSLSVEEDGLDGSLSFYRSDEPHAAVATAGALRLAAEMMAAAIMQIQVEKQMASQD